MDYNPSMFVMNVKVHKQADPENVHALANKRKRYMLQTTALQQE